MQPPRPSQSRRAVLGLPLGLAFGASASNMSAQTLVLPDTRIELLFEDGFTPAARSALAAWIERAAAAVRGYFGHFPLAQLEVQLHAVDGSGVRGGTTFGDPAPWIRLRAGRDTTAARLADDWVVVHEMVHLAVPRVRRPQSWLHEGIATYVEGVARGRAGLAAPREVWRSWMLGMPQGLPKPGEAGLDSTPTWGRTYWGGAMFCLLADVQMLQRSGGSQGLQQALQGLLAAGGDYSQAWDATRILATADAAVGQDTLTTLRAAHGGRAVSPDLDGLWRALGVDGPTLDDTAALATVRRAILG